MGVEEEREEEREALRMRIAEKEEEAESLQARLAEAAVLAEKAAEDVEMNGMHPPSHKAVADAATNTERRTYAQVAAHTQALKFSPGVPVCGRFDRA